MQLTPSVSLSEPQRVVWSQEMDGAFRSLSESLCSRVVLHVPCVSDLFILCTDVSGGGVGECLHVLRDRLELPVAFYSRQLRGAEKTYSVTELETLAIVAAIFQFDFYLYGSEVVIYTDHKACTSLLTSRQLNKRLKRFALKLQDRQLDIRYRPGKANGMPMGLAVKTGTRKELMRCQRSSWVLGLAL